MNRYHEQQQPTLFHLMNRKRVNQIQPSNITDIKTTNITNDKVSTSINNNSSSTFTSYSSSNSISERSITNNDAITTINAALKETQQQHDINSFPVDTYYTVPNLCSVLDRPLPSLPPKPTDNFTRQQQQVTHTNNSYKKIFTRQQQLNRQIHTGLQRAVTWLGMPFHKMLTTSIELPLMYNVNQDHLQQQIANSSSRRSLNNDTDKTIYCKVHQITNYASSKEYEYHLHLQLDGKTLETIPGIMEKVPVGSSTRELACDIPLNIDGSFDLTFILMAQPLNPLTSTLTKVKHRLGRKKKDVVTTKIKRKTATTTNHTVMPVIGVKQIVSGSFPDAFVGQGPLRYTMTQPLYNHQDRYNLELTVSFHSKKPSLEPSSSFAASPSSSCYSSNFSLHSNGINYFNNTTIPTTAHNTFNENNDIHHNPFKIDKHVLDHCEQGDYLTVYVRGQGYPTWRRYFVKLKMRTLLLFDESFKNVGRIPLNPLLSVTYASDQHDQETVRMSSTTGLVLRFERACAKLMEPARLEEHEILEGKVYLYADNTIKANYWMQIFKAYANNNNNINHHGTKNHHDQHNNNTDEDRINLRFMW
ncbi:hypothetical protein BDC45DRAFT_608617 [Circinella umbellata]|nr:hypothetical protein BDC45DRAFT_608617 [Circinella umbellata]